MKMGLLVFIKNILIMNKSQRIYLSSGDTGNDNQDKYITVKLEQDTETLEFMSLSLGTTDVYQNFNADYGVLVGRVIANGGIGIPNAKISIFIPISDEDTVNSEIYSIYPYTTPRDENNDGKRYNLLPRVSQKNLETQQLEPKQAFGSFPIKEEVVGNLPFLEVYKKYYKYTALTNNAGDYMIFGIPVGTQTVHMSCDITDIGEYSMNPASMVTNLGYSPNLFTNNNTRIKSSSDLGDLPNIETQEITVDIVPFWGDTENFEIGITRQDFRIRAILNSTFTMFGSVFSDQANMLWGSDVNGIAREIRDFFFVYPNHENGGGDSDWIALGAGSKRIGVVTETIYYYPSNISDAEIDSGDPEIQMMKLDPSNYSVYKKDGDFVFIINCNRDKIVTNELGVKIPVAYDDPNGVFTKFRGFVTLEITSENLLMNGSSDFGGDATTIKPFRMKLKFPQYAGSEQSFDSDNGTTSLAWRKQHAVFEKGKFYSFSKFHGTIANNDGSDPYQWNNIQDGKFFGGDVINVLGTDARFNASVIVSGDQDNVLNSFTQFPTNLSTTPTRFGANWLNLSIYLPQSGWMLDAKSNLREAVTNDWFRQQNEDATAYNEYYLYNNTQPIVAGDLNTKWFPRSDMHWTDIIEVPLNDIVEMNNIDSKGFKDNVFGDSYTIQGQYRNGDYVRPDWSVTTPCPYKGGRKDGNANETQTDKAYYFYKGFDTADCIKFLFELGLVT